MENIFRKYGWAMKLGVIAIACLLLALGVNSFIASKLAPYTVPTLPDMTAAKGADKKGGLKKRPRAVNRVAVLEKRCYFGCEEDAPSAGACEEECQEGERCVEGQCVPDVPVDNAPPSDVPLASDLNVKLVGVMVSNKPQWSTALIEDPASKQTYILRAGESIMGQATIVEVKRDRVIIDRSGRREYIRLENTITGNPSPTSSTPAALRSGKPQASTGGSKPVSKSEQAAAKKSGGTKVQQVSKGAFRVDRGALNEQLQDRSSLARAATIIPNYKNGKKAGLKLMNIQSASVYNQIGLQNGDVLRAVNGESIKSQAHAMELFEKFRKADKVRIELERNGKRETFNYDIR